MSLAAKPGNGGIFNSQQGNASFSTSEVMTLWHNTNLFILIIK